MELIALNGEKSDLKSITDPQIYCSPGGFMADFLKFHIIVSYSYRGESADL